jgi:hypothetical protein
MNKVYLQIWEESISNEGTRPDGCSLHIDLESSKSYLRSIYEFRENMKIPDEYDSAVGEPIQVLVNNNVFELIKIEKTIRLLQNEFNNLIQLKDILVE